ncbi:acyltransferase [uncultured Bifidobacterium sp.]|uniref:acyltransferase family protein n=1 Tax=uncultured Bifidobacterium sp. TaxID=165187 RepID=UPI0027DB5EFA|nr:acyltransferase [uncultured Bifidobacterium sp.]
MLRGIAMICVIAAHPEGIPEDIDCWIYSFHMPLFFMISGATFRYERYLSLKECVYDQIRKLLVPYAIMYIVCIPFWYINKIIFAGDQFNPISLIIGFFTAHQSIGVMPNGALWFLPTLFVSAVVFWWMFDLSEKRRIDLAASVSICFLFGFCLSSFVEGKMPLHLNCVPMIIVFYYFGYLLMQSYNKYILLFSNSDLLIVTVVLLLSIGSFAAFYNGKINVHDNEYNNILLALISSVFISLAIAIICIKMPVVHILSFIGQNTIIFLGYHIPIMRFFENSPWTKSFSEHHSLWLSGICILILIPISFFITNYIPILAGRIPPNNRVSTKR